MAIIYGEIESLKTLKKELNNRGINRFNSISEINSFKKNIENEKLKIIEDTKLEINQDVISKRNRIKKNKKEINVLLEKLHKELSNKIKEYSNTLKELESKKCGFLCNLINKIRYCFVIRKNRYLIENLDRSIHNESKKIVRQIYSDQSSVDNILKNREKVLLKRSEKKIERLKYTYETLNKLYPIVTGAIGESLVVKEIEKLPDEYILINDFNLAFEKPIYNKKNGDRIFSIQIDHLLISPAGIFIIETKNWSKKAINNYDLRSPVEQIRRTSFAMFVELNRISYRLNGVGTHHWGDNQIPIKNLVVMINNKPNNAFKYVKIIKLNELINYVSYFEKIFSKRDVNRIAEVLLSY